MALDKRLEFGSGILGAPQPQVLPVMRELVRRGVAAMSALLAHLSDDRCTKLVLNKATAQSRLGATWFGNGYEPREPEG